MAGEWYIPYNNVYGIRAVLALTNTYGRGCGERCRRPSWDLDQAAVETSRLNVGRHQLRDFTYVDDAVQPFSCCGERRVNVSVNLAGLCNQLKDLPTFSSMSMEAGYAVKVSAE